MLLEAPDYIRHQIAWARVALRVSSDGPQSRCRCFQWSIAVIGAITTTLIRMKAIPNARLRFYTASGVAAIIASTWALQSPL